MTGRPCLGAELNIELLLVGIERPYAHADSASLSAALIFHGDKMCCESAMVRISVGTIFTLQ